MRRNNKSAENLEAALHVVEERGANHLTIDAVAEKAGFSKGGVLYHFGSKKALLRGMLEQLIESMRSRAGLREGESSDLSRLLRAENQMNQAEKRASLALLAAAAEDRELLDPARKYINQLVVDLVEEKKDVDQLVLFLANEGLRFLEILELNPLTPAQTRRVMDHMGKRAGELK